MAMATDSQLVDELNNSERAAELRFAVDVNPLFTDKVKPGDPRYWKLNMTFRTCELTARELLGNIHQGFAWTAPHSKERHLRPDGKRTTFRVKRNVIGVQAIGLDSDTGDERSALDWWKHDDFFAAFGSFAHTSASHTDERPRCRVVFVVSEPLTVGDAELLLRALHERYEHVDHSAKDASRLFYGARGCSYVMPNNVMPAEVARALILPLQQYEEELRQAAEARRAAFASSRPDKKANADSVAAYVASAKDRRLSDVAAAHEGTGERHKRLIEAAFRLGSLRGAAWLTDEARRVLLGVEDELVGAAQANGYAAKYGEDATRREVVNSVALGERSPAYEPDWKKFASFFAVGDSVAIVQQGRTLARGVVAELRKGRGEDDYSFRLAGGNVWYPRAWLRHDGDTPDGRADDWPDGEPPDDMPSTPAGEPDDIAQGFFVAAGPALDGRGRDIYEGLAGSPALVVDLPPGAYLGDVLDVDDLPRHCQLNANTGTGKTTFAENLPGQTLIVTSSTVALEQIVERRRAAGAPCDAYYHKEKSAKADSQLIVTTYESFAKVLLLMDASKFTLVVDEVHNFAASSSRAFRGKALEAVVDTLEGDWRRVILMSGTPMPSSHPALRNYALVNVISQRRGQRAQRVVYEGTVPDGKTRGRKMEAVLAMCDLNRTHLIFQNNKKGERDKLIAGLIAKGFSREEVATLDSDTKDSATGESIIKREVIPDGVRVLITTSVLVEAANLRDKIDCVHLASDIHPYLAQQLVNRLRTDAAGVVYWYNAGDGRAVRASVHFHHSHYLREAQSQVDHLNRFASVNPEDSSDEAELNRRGMRVHAGKAHELVRIDGDEATGAKWWSINYLGVDHQTFEAIAYTANNNPLLYQNMLAPFGWQWAQDLELILARPNDKRRDELAGELREEREDAHRERIEKIRADGEAKTTVNLQLADGATLRAAGNVLRLKRELVRDAQNLTGEQDEEAWRIACELTLDAGDSKRKMNTLARRLKMFQLRGRCAFTDSFYHTFAVGERLAAEEVHRRVLATFAADPLMTFYAANRYKYHYSTAATPRISQARAVEMLGDLFTLKRTSQRDASGKVVNVYELVDDAPVGEVVFTFTKTIKQTIVNVNTNSVEDVGNSAAAAFAFTSAAEPATSSAQTAAQDAPTMPQDAPDEDEGDLLDWFLATGGHRTNYTWRNATA